MCRQSKRVAEMTTDVAAQKHCFLVELKTWPSGEIPYLTYASNDEEAKKKGQRFIWFMRWKGRVGKVEKCENQT